MTNDKEDCILTVVYSMSVLVRASKGYDPDSSEQELKLSLDEWQTVQNLESYLRVSELDRAVEYFERSLTPMQAVQECFAEIDDGDEMRIDEAHSLYGSSGANPLMGLMAAVVIFILVFSVVANCYDYVKQHQAKEDIETVIIR